MRATAPVMTLTTAATQLDEVLKEPKYKPILGPITILQREALATAYKSKPELTYAAAVNRALKKVKTLQESIHAVGSSVEVLLAIDSQVNELRADLRRLVTISDAEQPFVPFRFLDSYKLYVDVNRAIKNLRTVVLPAFSQDIAQKKAGACADVIDRINTRVSTKAYAARLDALNIRLSKVLLQETKPSWWDIFVPTFMKTKQKIKDQKERDAINIGLTYLLSDLKQHDGLIAAKNSENPDEVEAVNNATLTLTNVYKQLASSDFATVDHTTVTRDLLVLFSSKISTASVKKQEVKDAIRGLVKVYQDLPATALAAQREAIHYVLSMTVSDSGYVAEVDRGFINEISSAITSIRAAFEGEQAAGAIAQLSGLKQLNTTWLGALNVFVERKKAAAITVSSPTKAQKPLTELEANVDTHLAAYVNELTKALPGLSELKLQEAGSSRNASAIKSEVSSLVARAFDAYQEHYLHLTTTQRTTLSTFLESDVALRVLNLTKPAMEKRNLDLTFLDKLHRVISNLTANKIGHSDATLKEQIGEILAERAVRVSSISASDDKQLVNLALALFKDLADFYLEHAADLYAKASKNEVKPNVFILDSCEALLDALGRHDETAGNALKSTEQLRSDYKQLAETRLLALQNVLEGISGAALNSGKTPDFGAIRDVFMNLPVLLASQNDDFEDIQARTLAVITAFVDAYEANDVRFQGYDNVLSTLASVLSNYTYHLVSFKPVLERMNVLLQKKQDLSINWTVIDINVREIVDRLKLQLTDAKAISGLRKLSANFATDVMAALGSYASMASPERRTGIIQHLESLLGKSKPIAFSDLISKLSKDKRALDGFGTVNSNKENQSNSATNDASSTLIETLSQAASTFALTVGARVTDQTFNQVSDAHAFLAAQTARLAPAEYTAVDAALRAEISLLSAAIMGFAKQMPNMVRAADLPQNTLTNVSEASIFLRDIMGKLADEYNACCDSLVKLDALNPALVKAEAPVPAATTAKAAPAASFVPSWFPGMS